MKLEWLLYSCFVITFVIFTAIAAFTTDKALSDLAFRMASFDVSYLVVVPVWTLSLKAARKLLPIKDKDGKVILE